MGGSIQICFASLVNRCLLWKERICCWGANSSLLLWTPKKAWWTGNQLGSHKRIHHLKICWKICHVYNLPLNTSFCFGEQILPLKCRCSPHLGRFSDTKEAISSFQMLLPLENWLVGLESFEVVNIQWKDFVRDFTWCPWHHKGFVHLRPQ